MNTSSDCDCSDYHLNKSRDTCHLVLPRMITGVTNVGPSED
jgi:hypothetical protein